VTQNADITGGYSRTVNVFVRLEVSMTEIVLEEDDCLKLVVEADPGDVRVCFREKENGPYGWFETSACWHEVGHLEKALSLVKSNNTNIRHSV